MILIVVALVCVAVCFIVLSAMKKKKAAQAWPSVPGTVTSSRVQQKEDESDAVVTYSYAVNGKDYQGNRVGFFSRDTAQQVVSRYPSGKQVEVFYDPANPSSAVLER